MPQPICSMVRVVCLRSFLPDILLHSGQELKFGYHLIRTLFCLFANITLYSFLLIDCLYATLINISFVKGTINSSPVNRAYHLSCGSLQLPPINCFALGFVPDFMLSLLGFSFLVDFVYISEKSPKGSRHINTFARYYLINTKQKQVVLQI